MMMVSLSSERAVVLLGLNVGYQESLLGEPMRYTHRVCLNGQDGDGSIREGKVREPVQNLCKRVLHLLRLDLTLLSLATHHVARFLCSATSIPCPLFLRL